ncbi:MAG: hypothetical protein FWG10_14460 [Eubacteriaceae bacterium]|nr:hypothetical protein [Eubacteriaceae bacterium]
MGRLYLQDHVLLVSLHKSRSHHRQLQVLQPQMGKLCLKDHVLLVSRHKLQFYHIHVLLDKHNPVRALEL